MINGEAVIPKDQLANIINMDETCLSLDGSNAAGKALPPHFQFQMAAQSDETERLRHEMM